MTEASVVVPQAKEAARRGHSSRCLCCSLAALWREAAAQQRGHTELKLADAEDFTHVSYIDKSIFFLKNDIFCVISQAARLTACLFA